MNLSDMVLCLTYMILQHTEAYKLQTYKMIEDICNNN